MENSLKIDTEKILNYMKDNNFIGTYKIEDNGIILWKISDRVWYIICLAWHGGDDSILKFYPKHENDSIWDAKRKYIIGEEYENLEKRDNNELTKVISEIEKLEKAHLCSSKNKNMLLKEKKCGCFYCLKIFDVNEIEDWLKDGTVLCPYCTIDSVIGENSGSTITKKFLSKMNKYWF